MSDVRARAMRRHAAAAGSSSTTTTRALLRYLRGDGVEVLATVARDAAAARRALATTTTATTRDLTSDAPSPSRWCASPFVASWRGFAAGAHRPAGGARGGRGGRGGGNLAAAIKLNGEIVASRSAAELLSIVAERGGDFNEVNVATAVNKLAKVARERDNLRGDPRYARLLELVRLRCRELQARHVANVVHGLGVLCADKGAGDVDADTAGELIRMVERNAGGFNSQNVSNVYNGLTKLPAAAAAMSLERWRRLSEAASRFAAEMNSQDIANTLNALGKIDAAAEVISSGTGWSRLIEAAERLAPEMKAQEIANTLNALGKVDAAAEVVSSGTGWSRLIGAAERLTPEMNNQNIANVLNALGKIDAAERAVSSGTGWSRLIGAAERLAPEMTSQNIANTLNALGKIGAAERAVSSGTGWSRLIGAAERLAPEMNAQDIAHVLNALGKIDAAAVKVSSAGWSHFATAVERTSGVMIAQNVSNVVNAYAEMRRVSEAPEAVSDAGWRSLAAAARRTAPAMTSQNIALTVDAAKKLDAFAMAIDDDGWNKLARQVPRVARDFIAQEVVLVLSAAGWKLELAKALARVDGGWDSTIASAERHMDAIKTGWNPSDLGRQARKTVHSLRFISELDGGTFLNEGLERVRAELEEFVRADPAEAERMEKEYRGFRVAHAEKARATAAGCATKKTSGGASAAPDHLLAELARVWRDDAWVAARDAWVKALPPKRKLDIAAMHLDAEKLALVVWSAEGDATKVRAKARRALLEAAGAVLAKAEGLNAEAGGALFDAMTKRLVPEFRERIAEAMMLPTTTTRGSGGGG